MITCGAVSAPLPHHRRVTTLTRRNVRLCRGPDQQRHQEGHHEQGRQNPHGSALPEPTGNLVGDPSGQLAELLIG